MLEKRFTGAVYLVCLLESSKSLLPNTSLIWKLFQNYTYIIEIFLNSYEIIIMKVSGLSISMKNGQVCGQSYDNLPLNVGQH